MRKYIAAQRMYEFIVAYKRAHDGNSPSYPTLVQGLGYTTNSAVRLQLDRLVKQGRIAIIDHKIHVVGGKWDISDASE